MFPEVDAVTADVAAHHLGFFLRQGVLPVGALPDQQGNGDVPAVQHLGQLDADEAAADDHGRLYLRRHLFQVLEVLGGNHAADPLEVLPRPAEFVPFAAAGDDELVVQHRCSVGELQFVLRGVDALNVVLFQIDAVLFPEERFVGHQIFPAHVAHVGVHKGGAREVELGLGGDDGDPDVIVELTQPAGRGYSGDAVADDGDVHDVWVTWLMTPAGEATSSVGVNSS